MDIGMPVDDETRTVFKEYSPKVASGRNSFSPCQYLDCHNAEQVGGPKFSVCASCKSARYCCREHQIADWKFHKDDCRAYEELDEESQRIEQLLEDFVKLQYPALLQIINYFFHKHPKVATIDPSGLSAAIWLTHRTKCGGNPARAFHLRNITFGHAISEDEYEAEYRRDLNINRQNDPNFNFPIYCHYFLDELHPRKTRVNYSGWAAICEQDRPFKKTKTWLKSMLNIIDHGIVLRSVEGDDGLWTPGILKQSGSKWIWKRRSIEQLIRITGIVIPPVMLWGQVRSSSILIDPDTAEPWAAPKDFWDVIRKTEVSLSDPKTCDE